VSADARLDVEKGFMPRLAHHVLYPDKDSRQSGERKSTSRLFGPGLTFGGWPCSMEVNALHER